MFNDYQTFDDRYDLTVITPPTIEPVDVQFLMDQCRIDDPDEVATVTALGIAGRDFFERSCNGLTLITTTFEVSYNCFGGNLILPRRPLQNIVSVKYDDQSGVEQTLDDSRFRINSKTTIAAIAQTYGTSWPIVRPQSNAVRMQFKAGISDDPADIPQTIKLAIGQWVATQYANRESVTDGNYKPMPHAYEAIVKMFSAPRV